MKLRGDLLVSFPRRVAFGDREFPLGQRHSCFRPDLAAGRNGVRLPAHHGGAKRRSAPGAPAPASPSAIVHLCGAN
jgi:hypothetical protein